MRLLVITQYFWPEDFRVNELVSELTSRGHDVTVLTGTPNYPEGRAFPAFRDSPQAFSAYAGAEVLRVPMIVRGRNKLTLIANYVSFAVSATIHGAIRLRRRDFDAVFVFEPSPVTVGIPAVVLRRLRGWPVAFWVLDQWPDTLAAVGVVRSPRGLETVGKLVRWIYTRCDIILSPSRRLIPRIASYCKPGQRIEYFPNWVEASYEQTDDKPALEMENEAASIPPWKDGFVVMFAGNLGTAQDFPAIMDAAEQLRGSPIRWVIVGDGRMADWVRAEIQKRALEDKVVMLGRFPAQDMPGLFRHADALLVSLRPDPVFALTSPGKIQAYLAFGKPVLAMLDGEGAAVIEDARAGFAGPAGDSRTLAENIIRLSALSAEQRRALGDNGAEYARQHFSRRTLVDRLEQWLGEIAVGQSCRDTA